MDVRDVKAWIKEAGLKIMADRMERYAASLLPHRKTEDVTVELRNLDMKVYELEHEDQLIQIEKMAKKRLAEIKRKKARRRKK